jgi:hypothetical protein
LTLPRIFICNSGTAREGFAVHPKPLVGIRFFEKKPVIKFELLLGKNPGETFVSLFVRGLY